MFQKLESKVVYGTEDTPKAKTIIYKCNTPTQVMRLHSGRYAIFALVPTHMENGYEEIGLVRLSEETYIAEVYARQALIEGSYTLNKDYKSYHQFSLTENIKSTYTSLLPCGEGKFMLGVILYEEDDNTRIELTHIRQSKETFSTKEDAEKALQTGNWVHEYIFDVCANYLNVEKLSFHVDEDNIYWIVRRYAELDVSSGEYETKYKERIETHVTNLDDAEIELKQYLVKL